MAASVAWDGSLDNEWIWQRVRMVDEDVAVDLSSRGLRPIEPDGSSRELFRLAARHLELVPSLEVELMRLVGQVTLLEADPGYDVSHSEPRWPSNIFVSAPSATARHATLRLLENIVHEGMHLRLTQIEGTRPLVRADAGRLFSPWKSQDRDAQGVLHGVYVFASVAALFAQRQLLAGLGEEDRQYAARRLSEIGAELDEVDLDALERGLNCDGHRFLRALLAPAAEGGPWTLLACEERGRFRLGDGQLRGRERLL